TPRRWDPVSRDRRLREAGTGSTQAAANSNGAGIAAQQFRARRTLWSGPRTVCRGASATLTGSCFAVAAPAARPVPRVPMSVTQPRTIPGVLELLPLDQVAFQGMLDAIRRNFERFGFLPIETPVMEFSNILLTKEGGETERQVYFVQSTGSMEQGGKPQLALRFGLHLPPPRSAAQHH